MTKLSNRHLTETMCGRCFFADLNGTKFGMICSNKESEWHQTILSILMDDQECHSRFISASIRSSLDNAVANGYPPTQSTLTCEIEAELIEHGSISPEIPSNLVTEVIDAWRVENDCSYQQPV